MQERNIIILEFFCVLEPFLPCSTAAIEAHMAMISSYYDIATISWKVIRK